jgi:hypothetical protein
MTIGRRRSRPWLLPIVAALAVTAVGAGCADRPPSPPSTQPSPDRPSPDQSSPAVGTAKPPASAIPPPSPNAALGRGLLLLAGRTGSMRLEWIGSGELRKPLPLPDPGLAWLSLSRAGRLLATTLDGRGFIAEPIGEGPPAWRRLAMAGIDPGPLAGPLAFGSLASDGTRAAFVAADFGTNAVADVVVVAVDGSTASRIRIGRPADGAAPAWLDDRLVILTRTPEDQVGSTIVGPIDATQPRAAALRDGPGPGATAGWRDPIAGLSIAADGSRLAVASAGDGRIEIHPAAAWLAGAETMPEPVELKPELDGSRSFAWLAISPAGDRLAVVRTDSDGESVAVTLHDRAAAWDQVARMALPVGADRAVVAWLP